MEKLQRYYRDELLLFDSLVLILSPLLDIYDFLGQFLFYT